jgi:alkyl sulfatase BDS1-like metallo-beta-lactamase superfamily hydrolase
VRATLPFDDKRDFEESKKGFIAAPEYKQIMAEAGNVAWDMGSYQWLLQDKQFDSIHPSLQRQAVLNMAYGLYEVIPDKIYQLRGFDLDGRQQRGLESRRCFPCHVTICWERAIAVVERILRPNL